MWYVRLLLTITRLRIGRAYQCARHKPQARKSFRERKSLVFGHRNTYYEKV
jgi:hypothetical protein